LVDFLSDALGAGSLILDVGCGQGRDAVWLARAGHLVTGIDPSIVGVSQLQRIVAKQNLAIDAQVANMETYQATRLFDCVLFDRTLHMLPVKDRIAGFARLLDRVGPAGCVVVLDEAPNLAELETEIPYGWDWIWGGKSDFAYRRPLASSGRS
tara:strand:+ start:7087 stop:7545 length:459 start_codon:yes stop_codon:yes gene_type:complete